MNVVSLVLTNRADIDQKTWFEDYGAYGGICNTCHCKYGPMYHCPCSNIMCEACVKWSRSNVSVIDLNQNKRTKARQRYVLQILKFNSYICNKCKKTVGYRL